MAPHGRESDVWERYKKEIRSLYGRMTLKAVKERMERDEHFPNYSLSMWKKKVSRWGFDNKYNKRSTIEAAAVHYRTLPREKKTRPFTSTNGKIISKEELHRYLRRNRMVFWDGKLQPKVGVAHDTDDFDPPPQPQFDAYSGDRGHNTEGYSTNALERSHKVLDAGSQLSPEQQRLLLGHRQHMQRLKMAYLFGQGTVSVSDLVVPEPSQNLHLILKGIQNTMQSSWNAGLWSINENYNFVSTQDSPSIYQAFNLVNESYYGIALLHGNNPTPHTRRALLVMLECLLTGLNYLFPATLDSFLDRTLCLVYETNPLTVIKMLRICSSYIGSANCVYPSIQHFFSALANTHPDDLVNVLKQAGQVWADSIVVSDNETEWSVWLRLWRITRNVASDSKEKAAQLSSYANSLQSSRWVDPVIVAECLNFLAWELHLASENEDAKVAIQQGLQLVEEKNSRFPKATVTAMLWHARAHIRHEEGDVHGAIADLENILSISSFLCRSLILDMKRERAKWYLEIDDQTISQDLQSEFEEHVRGLSTLSLEDEIIETEFAELCPETVHLCNDHPSSSSDNESIPSSADIDIGKTWQKYIEGEAYHPKEPHRPPSEWREAIHSTTRESLMLYEPFSDDGIDWGPDCLIQL